jgi:hypothetical protein
VAEHPPTTTSSPGVESDRVAPLGPGMRRLLIAATVLVTLAGFQLYVVPTRTAEWFAWTVDPPVTAAFLGAAYWASATVQLTSSRARTWADARVAVLGVFVFTTLTLVVTLVHLDRFHLGSESALATRAVTWLWIAIYALVPVLMTVLWVRQERVPGVDPPRTRPLAVWLLGAIGIVAALLLAYGTWLLVAPEPAARWWPWELTPLTGRAVGAWLVGLGVSGAQAVREADARRARPVAVGAVALAVLAGVALVRFADNVDGGAGAGVAAAALLSVWAVLGAAMIVAERRPRGG